MYKQDSFQRRGLIFFLNNSHFRKSQAVNLGDVTLFKYTYVYVCLIQMYIIISIRCLYIIYFQVFQFNQIQFKTKTARYSRYLVSCENLCNCSNYLCMINKYKCKFFEQNQTKRDILIFR